MHLQQEVRHIKVDVEARVWSQTGKVFCTTVTPLLYRKKHFLIANCGGDGGERIIKH